MARPDSIERQCWWKEHQLTSAALQSPDTPRRSQHSAPICPLTASAKGILRRPDMMALRHERHQTGYIWHRLGSRTLCDSPFAHANSWSLASQPDQLVLAHGRAVSTINDGPSTTLDDNSTSYNALNNHVCLSSCPLSLLDEGHHPSATSLSQSPSDTMHQRLWQRACKPSNCSRRLRAQVAVSDSMAKRQILSSQGLKRASPRQRPCKTHCAESMATVSAVCAVMGL
ncbi:hypothetical protein MAA_11206 [Metarhizium robertsii ARSEF 23]|uniref:Uncharacterized protein n=1 Tax=Metarhizium robertsii (strain ARSEF 23 / ATCC MYA-3075) TaxID=655844 RepID=A0A0B2X8E8_METRA|nr:uncharacterized protein MAA_11206 [Metarhizium robertsii ARSEF 23]KHO11128.1 hypothetical protein MAA_11206 [Metarhizium robertsii ARSEF 23]